MIINIISSLKGGGAELLVRELHKLYLAESVDSHAIYLAGDSSDVGKCEKVIGVNPRSPLSIFHIRKLLKVFLAQSQSNLIVHAHLTWPFFYVALASIGLKNLILVYTEHNTLNKRRRIPLFRYIERLVYSRYSKIICISPGVYQSLAPWIGQRLKERMVVVPNGSRIYSMVERSSLGSNKPSLVSIGSLTLKKNFSTALLAIADIKDQISSYTIVGEGPERSRLEHLIRQYNLEEIVTLVGWTDTIEKYLQTSHIQVIPSLWEGFGLVAVEGMSTGLLIVASNVDGLRDVLGQTNPAVTFVDNFQDRRAWAVSLQAAIEKIYTEDMGELGLAARQQAEKFTLDSMVKRYLEVYSSVSQLRSIL
jgi:glycosyltransferase involved in cell wall biosynthesis